MSFRDTGFLFSSSKLVNVCREYSRGEVRATHSLPLLAQPDFSRPTPHPPSSPPWYPVPLCSH